MTGSTFEAMDVVVAKKIVNREEVWRRGGDKLTRKGTPGDAGKRF